jgi:hypothetical protein
VPGQAQPDYGQSADLFTPRPKPAQPEMYVYRDNGEPDEPEPVAVAQQDERDAAYWYGVAEPEQPEPVPEVRGPFEPLTTTPAAGADAAMAPPEPEPDPEPEDAGEQHQRKLEQIKDFYLTAEAIGEENVDKHFDQLLAQQRELIGEYFKQSGVNRAVSGEDAVHGDQNAQDGSAQAEAAPT